MSEKFENEKRVTDAFLKSKGVIQYELTKPENDPPDVIAKIASTLVGIEVTAIISSEPTKILEDDFNSVFTRVEEHLVTSGIGNLVIRIEPERIKQEKKVSINRDKCVEVIVDTCLKKLDQIGFDRTELAINPTPGIKKITAYRLDDERVIITFNSKRHTFGPLWNKKIKSVIEEKIQKLNKAKQKTPKTHSMIHEYWLLMTIKGTFYANYTGVGIQDGPVLIKMKNCFDKIFVYHEARNWIVEIQPVYNG